MKLHVYMYIGIHTVVKNHLNQKKHDSGCYTTIFQNIIQICNKQNAIILALKTVYRPTTGIL